MPVKRIILSVRLLAGFVLFGVACNTAGPTASNMAQMIATIPAVASLPTVTPSPTPTITPMPTPNVGAELRRGVNLANMLEAPVEGQLGLMVHEEYFGLIKQAGFDFVRVPIRWDAHAALTVPYTIDPKFFDRVDEIIGWAIQHNLTIILDFHNYGGIMTDPVENKARFLGIWKQIAEHYKDYPPQVIFELLNEPNDLLNAAIWN